MGLLSKKKAQSPTDPVTSRDPRLDGIYRALRTITARVTDLEAQVATLKRDRDRIERKQNRELEPQKNIQATVLTSADDGSAAYQSFLRSVGLL